MDSEFDIKVHNTINDIDKDQFNSIQDNHNPFLEYEFLYDLEQSGCIGEYKTWNPRYLILYKDLRVVGSITFFIKLDSYGEYIFDWDWARAYSDAGLNYYPKVVVGIPFTPATGKRILVDDNLDYFIYAGEMINYLIEYCKELEVSSIHFLHTNKTEHKLLNEFEFLPRITHQYHWHNRDYSNFDQFLDDLKSSKRKQVKKERNSIRNSNIGIEVMSGDEIKHEHIDAMWDFYSDTHMRKWGSAYLNKHFFDLLFENFRHRIVVVLAKEHENWIAGSFNFRKNSRLFGRYWGTITNKKYLHFECCYYSLIEFSINMNIHTFEAGAQGEHKFLRGFKAEPIYSSHLIFHEGANRAIDGFLDNEREYMRNLIKSYNSKSPLKYLTKV